MWRSGGRLVDVAAAVMRKVVVLVGLCVWARSVGMGNERERGVGWATRCSYFGDGECGVMGKSMHCG